MDQALRLGVVCVQDATDIRTWSGIPAHVLESLRKWNVHIELYSPLSDRKKYLLAPVKALARVRKSNITLDHYPLMLKYYASQIKDAMRKRPVDLIVSTSSIPVAALDCEQPIIFWTDAVFHAMHGYYNGAFGEMSFAAIERGKRQEESALDRCAFAAYSSEWAAESARRLTDPGKIKILPFGPNFEIHHTRSDVEKWLIQRRTDRAGKCELLFIGVDWERKGGGIALETAKILNERGIPTRLTVAGCNPPGPLPNFVRVLGFISKATAKGQEQMQALLREADFFILPTLAECSPIVVCETSAFGLPSLSYATGGVPEYVRSRINGVCLPVGTPAEGFANAVQEILQNAGRYETLCLGAFNEYATRLNWDSSVRGLVDLCCRALGRNSPATVQR